MHILVLNCGSSSLKAAVIDHLSGKRVVDLSVTRVGESAAVATINGATESGISASDHREALATALPILLKLLPEGVAIAGVGHRVVHGGERFVSPTRIDAEVESAIEALTTLAPLHNPANLAGIRAAREILSDVPHVAVFDTAFHATLPRRASTYAIDAEIAAKHGVRRYGFHGTSHRYVAERAAEFLDEKIEDLRLITCHLGNGASVCAVEFGRSVETSMGMTPLEGLVMGTRSGDLDPGALLHIMRAEGLDADGVDRLLNKQSGLKGLSGVTNDLRDIEERAAAGDDRCRNAIQVSAHRLRKYIGAYAATLGGVDAIIFTGGIGENSAQMRHRAAQRLDYLGAKLDEDKNRSAELSDASPVVAVNTPNSRVKILAVKTDEAHAIAQEAAFLVDNSDKVEGGAIPIAVSARHIHLTKDAIATLFGPGHELTPRNELSQPKQFACEETLDVIGPKRTLEGVRILGPARSKNQVEISRTDEFYLGIDAPVRNSGDVAGSAGVTLRGPHGELTIKEGVICARRHIHMRPEDAERFGVQDRDVVEVAINSDGRDLVFGDVLIRVSPKYALEMHIDTDEANAAELSRQSEGLLVGTTGTAQLTKKKNTRDRGGREQLTP